MPQKLEQKKYMIINPAFPGVTQEIRANKHFNNERSSKQRVEQD